MTIVSESFQGHFCKKQMNTFYVICQLFVSTLSYIKKIKKGRFATWSTFALKIQTLVLFQNLLGVLLIL